MISICRYEAVDHLRAIPPSGVLVSPLPSYEARGHLHTVAPSDFLVSHLPPLLQSVDIRTYTLLCQPASWSAIFRHDTVCRYEGIDHLQAITPSAFSQPSSTMIAVCRYGPVEHLRPVTPSSVLVSHLPQ
jgi:hypothetical protein